MKVKLKHVISAKKRLADGTCKTYYYHRITRKRIHGLPGTPEFLDSYIEAEKRETADISKLLQGLIDEYQKSEAFLGLAPRTQKDYRRQIVLIEDKFGSLPIKALNNRRIRGDFLTWRDEIAKVSPKQADYMWSVMRRIVSWAWARKLKLG